jgi:regulator of protease activity HflC (stomatin/prohibitin superfamily)
MESAFAWLGKIFDALLEFVPRRVIVRATEGGVRWGLWGGPKEIKPGFRVWWPLITDIEIIIVARQPINTPTQSLVTKDGKTVVAGGVVIFHVNDVVKAIGQQNWSYEDTASDITQATLVEVISSWNYNELLENISGEVETQLTEQCRKNLRQFGLYVGRCALVDFSKVRQLNHSGININVTQAS